MKKRTVAVVPVRMGSARFPGKALQPILGKPLLGYLLDRLSLCRSIDDIVVATSIAPENDAISSYCTGRDVACFRGDEDDVMGRLLGALESRNADVGVLVFGDTPLIDPRLVDDFVDRFAAADVDFLSNDLTTTYPPGMEVEVFAVLALRVAEKSTQDPIYREHGTLYIRKHPKLFSIENVEAPKNYRRPEMELEVDTPEDFEVISEIIDHFSGRMDFCLSEIIDFMDQNPTLSKKNQHLPRRWKAFREDAVETSLESEV